MGRTVVIGTDIGLPNDATAEQMQEHVTRLLEENKRLKAEVAEAEKLAEESEIELRKAEARLRAPERRPPAIRARRGSARDRIRHVADNGVKLSPSRARYLGRINARNLIEAERRLIEIARKDGMDEAMIRDFEASCAERREGKTQEAR